MLNSIAYFISGIVLFSLTVFPSGVLEADELNTTLHGTVIEAESHDPIGNATVTVSGQDASTETGRDGTFRFNDLEQGEYTLVVSAEGYSEKELQVTLQSPEEEVIIELEPAY